MKINLTYLRLSLVAVLLGAGQVGAPGTVADILLAQGFHQGSVVRAEGANWDFIKVEIDGHPFFLLIDTGSFLTSLSMSAAKRAHLAMVPSKVPMFGVNGVIGQTYLAQVSNFTVEGVNFEPGPILVAPYRDPHMSGRIPFDGVLGLAAMKLNHVLFGYDPGEFFFRSTGASTGGLNSFLLDHGFARINLESNDEQYFLSVSFNGTPAKMFLDSGAQKTLLSMSFDQRAKLSATNNFMMDQGSDGTAFPALAVIPQRIEIGPLLLPRMPVTAGNASLLGLHVKGGAMFADGDLGFDLTGRLSPLLDTGHDWLYITGFQTRHERP